MPSVSPKQHRFMEAIAHDAKFAAKVGVPQKVGKDFTDADKATGKYARGGGSKSAVVPGTPPKIHTHGLIGGGGTGRSDSIPLRVPRGGYMVPADVVSGVGHGNTLAGARALENTFPMHNRIPNGRARVHGFVPLMPTEFGHGFKANAKVANGGPLDNEHGAVDIEGSEGEFLIHPNAITAKYGNLKKGHQILDQWVIHRRKKTIKEMRNLKPPRHSKQAKGK